MGNDTAQSHFIAAYADSRFPPTVTKPAAKIPQAVSESRSATSLPQRSSAPQAKPQHKSTTASSTTSAPPPAAHAYPTSSSNAKLQVVQAPAVNLSLPATPVASTSQRTLEHVSSEAAAEIAQRKLRQIEQQLRAAKGQSKEKACFCQGECYLFFLSCVHL